MTGELRQRGIPKGVSVACGYQTLPAAPFPALPGRDEREII